MNQRIKDIPTLDALLPKGFMESWKKVPSPPHDEEKEKVRREKEHAFWLGVLKDNDRDFQKYSETK
jgi:hypothetical protein